MASSAHDRLPLTANLGLQDQIFARGGRVFALPRLKCPSLGGYADGFFSPWQVEPRRGRSVISMAPQSWPGARSGASQRVDISYFSAHGHLPLEVALLWLPSRECCSP